MNLSQLSWFSLFFMVSCTMGIMLTTIPASASADIPEDYEWIVKMRMRSMDCVVAPRLNDDVKLFLSRYIFKHPRSTERMLGNAALFFPVFDKILEEKNLPTSLKALSILESWLDLGATSRVGAGGLWQLMPQTARMYGLTVNGEVDERRDIFRSTEAALNLLSKLFDIYGDWGLALAAYNAGPLKVNRAIEKSGAGDQAGFWTIAPYLPRETQQFVPKFIALTYLLHHYADHDIYPEFPDLDLQFIDGTKVYQKLSFQEVKNVTGLDLQVIKSLNPSYKQNFIPASKSGFNLVLPSRVLPQMEEYLNLTDKSERSVFISDLKIGTDIIGDLDDIRVNYVETSHLVKKGETLQDIAQKYQTDITRIILWNHLSSDILDEGIELSLFLPLDKYLENRVQQHQALARIPVRKLAEMEIVALEYMPIMPGTIFLDAYDWHVLQPGESLWDVCIKYGISNLASLLELNAFSDFSSVGPGSKIKVRLVFLDKIAESEGIVKN